MIKASGWPAKASILLVAFCGMAHAGTITRTSAFTYDATGHVAKEVIEPTNSDACVVTEYVYDATGNRKQSTTRNCNGSALVGFNEAAAPTGEAVFAARTTQTSYAANGHFPTQASNALGHTVYTTIEGTYGNLMSSIDVNGLATPSNFDAFGRKIEENHPGGTRTKWEYLYCSGINGGTQSCPTYAVYLVRTRTYASNGTTEIAPPVTVYFDALDRDIRTDTIGFDGSTTIRMESSYDSLMRLARTTRPYYIGQTVYWNTYTYDALGRVLTLTEPSGAVTQTSYNGLTTTVTNAKNQAEVRTVNSQGQVVTVQDAANGIQTFSYDATGNLVSTTDPDGLSMQSVYDVRGRKTQMTDPDMGTWHYYYDALGELVRQVDAKNQTTQLQYDLLGRMTRRAEPDLISNWYYDQLSGASCKRGLLCKATSDNGYQRIHNYDNLSRPSSTIETIDEDYTTSITYDAYGRPSKLTYPGGFAVNNGYTLLGYLRTVTDSDSGTVYWQANSMDAEGHVLSQTLGNNAVEERGYYANTGRIRSISASASGLITTQIEQLIYDYDLLGNVTNRDNEKAGVSESFGYDALNRLTSSTVNSSGAGVVTTNYQYSPGGNLKSRTGLGTITYATNTHQAFETVQTDGSHIYSYDGNGNLYSEGILNGSTIDAIRTIDYTSFNMTAQIHEPAKLLVHAARNVTFQYGPEHQRIRQDGAGGVSTIYLNPANGAGLFYEKDLLSLGRAEQRYFVSANGQAVALIKKNKSGGTTSTQYLHYDALGSVAAVTNSLRTVQDQLSYEPFGKRRELNGEADANDSIEGKQTDRGFTGHEHLEDFQLINMNGRIYSPVLGRFLSADPNIPNPSDPQSYNRYSYVRNNPLAYTDPSGYFHISMHRVGREMRRWERDFRHELRNPNSLLGPALRVMTYSASTWCGYFAAACVAGSEYTISKYQGVSDRQALRGASIAAAESYAFYEIGTATEGGGYLGVGENLLGHAAVGCVSAAAAHGNCGQGAAAAFIGDGAGMLGQGNFALGLALSTAGGGIGSVITGGKFGDGAVTGAFGYAYNCYMHPGTCNFSDKDAIVAKASKCIGTQCFYEVNSDAREAGILKSPDLGASLHDLVVWDAESVVGGGIFKGFGLVISNIRQLARPIWFALQMSTDAADIARYSDIAWNIRSIESSVWQESLNSQLQSQYTSNAERLFAEAAGH